MPKPKVCGFTTNDAQLLARSRIKRLEAALASELVGRQQEIIANKILREFDAVVAAQRTVLAARRRGAIEQAAELEGLRGRNIGRVPTAGVLGRLVGRFYKGPLTYAMSYWYGSLGTVTLGPNSTLARLPFLHSSWAFLIASI